MSLIWSRLDETHDVTYNSDNTEIQMVVKETKRRSKTILFGLIKNISTRSASNNISDESKDKSVIGFKNK